MDRELLLEIGCEELPASWLPPLTQQIGERMAARLAEVRLPITAPVETFSTPRRLTVRIARVADRQTDLEQRITGPPVSAAFGTDGAPTPAAVGFARKYGVGVSDLARVETPKGTYLAYHQRQRSHAAVDVLPEALTGVLRDLTFPRLMRWDAWLDDGRGELLFGRPIRWLLFLYGARVVPFAIKRTPLAQGGQVQEVRSAATTYGHRFLTTSGRAGRAVKVRTFEEYRARLAEHFVVLDRGERSERIARELDAHARRLGGRVSRAASHSPLLQEVADLVEYPSVVGGAFPVDFLDLPDEVLTTTMIHHQHYFPVDSNAGRLLPAFLAVINSEPDNARTIARNSERVLSARLRDARFFWQADRRIPLEARLDRLDTVLFHGQVGTYRTKALRLEALAEELARDWFDRPDDASHAREAGRLAKTDLTTEMVRELTELQGTMGGIYAREEGRPEEVWKAIYYHYLPVGVEADAPPARDHLGPAAVTWASVALADKLDTLVALFAVGERPTGSRDPFALRRQAHGFLKILVDLPELTGVQVQGSVPELVRTARQRLEVAGSVQPESESLRQLIDFLAERLRYLFEQRGFRYDEINAIAQSASGLIDKPLDARYRLEALRAMRGSEDFAALAILFKRVKNIAKELPDEEFEAAARSDPPLDGLLNEPAERELHRQLMRFRTVASTDGVEQYRHDLAEAATLRPAVDRFFVEVLVMTEDPAVRRARLRLMKELERRVLRVADISQIVPRAE